MRAMSEWNEFLGPDGIPPLWPHAPRWLRDRPYMRDLLTRNRMQTLIRTVEFSYGTFQPIVGGNECEMCGKDGAELICMCGERYCSKACQRADWANHRDMCRTIYDNNPVQCLVTKLEMKDTIDRAAWAAAGLGPRSSDWERREPGSRAGPGNWTMG